jgi:hypothetical protein
MLVVSQYHIFESYKTNIYRVEENLKDKQERSLLFWFMKNASGSKDLLQSEQIFLALEYWEHSFFSLNNTLMKKQGVLYFGFLYWSNISA